MNRLVVALFAQFLTVSLLAVNLTGKVVDLETQKAIQGATIQLKGQSKEQISSKQGLFQFNNLKAGSYSLSVEKTGYLPKSITLDLRADFNLTLELKAQTVYESMTVSATRAVERSTPVVFSDMSSEAIMQEHTVEDVPMLLVGQPNVYSYSDDGSGMGYSYLKIRGFDQSRIGVMVNGIPLNDPEDHQVYWVDMPDFAESLDSIQIQRGVGSSLYGVDTFGGSVNLQTTQKHTDETYQAAFFGGSYATLKASLKAEIPLADESWHLSVRASSLKTDGYRDNSGSEQWAGYLALARFGEESVTRIIAYTGNEYTHAAWEASAESDLQENHRHNPISYDNIIDNFTQPHYELHHSWFPSDQIHWKNTVFAIKGKGYYEQYKYGRDMWEYGLWEEPDTAPEADIIRQKWVRKEQYGWISEFNLEHDKGKLTVGSYWSTYNSNHWGEVDDLMDLDLPNYTPDFIYYRYVSDKDTLALYVNELFKPNDQLTIMANLHYQDMDYSLDQQEAGNFKGENLHSLKTDYRFFSPRFGINWNIDDQFNVFFNVSRANREPADSQLFDTWQGPDDLGVAPLFNQAHREIVNSMLIRTHWTDPQVKEEELTDYELGALYRTPAMSLRANFFYMDFRNEIVPYGQVNDDGFPIRGNADKTVHRGVELSGTFKLNDNWTLDTNYSINDNYFKEFEYKEFDWGTGEVATLDFSGNTIAGFPDIVANTTITYTRSSFNTSLRWQHFGRQYLDNTEDAERIIPDYNMLHAWAHFSLPWKGRLDDAQLSLKINNITNEKTYSAGYYDAWAGENYYWPTAGTHAQLGLRLTFKP
ncbi:MAG: hypothetical protein CR997_13385 [Acidobacteria bacterium]|nr:MAG: hypothetical protein CR997_13385 [Acidobacteriota bacterium]